jgi:uncharacterized protein (DUF433 family)
MTSLRRHRGYSLDGVEELAADDPRASEPLYTIKEAALFLGVKPSTLGDWLEGRSRSRPFVHVVEDQGEPFIPFIGFAEAAVTSVLRRALSAQYIRKALARLQDELGKEYALASKDLYVHGAQMLYDYLDPDGTKKLVEVVSGNAVFRPIVEQGLRRIVYADGYATSLVLPKTRWDVLSVDPRWASGQPLTITGGARLVDLLRRFGAGEDPLAVAKDYRVPEADMLEIIRVFYRAPEGPEVPRAA